MTSEPHFPARRLTLADLLPGIPVLLAGGANRHRNFKAFTYPFRASSHYLFFGAPNEPDHVLLILNGEATLYRPKLGEDDAVWHGETATDEELKSKWQLQEVKSIEELPEDLSTLGVDEVLSLPSPDEATNAFVKQYLGRVPSLDEDPDIDLVDAMMELRRCQDDAAQEGVRKACRATVALQKAVLGQCAPGVTEAALKGVYDRHLAENSWQASFQPIISVAGEVLHNPYYHNELKEGDLLLVDCGAEVSGGYAGDLTRTVPVSGTFTETQKAVYDIVDRARAESIEMIAPGVHFKDLHMKASLVIAEGLVDLGILKGEPKDLVDKGVHALFFCHGLGHLVGLDVHDMEDFGDRIGYEEGEEREEQFGLSNLRLSRELEVGMVVTIEPGYYRIPALLSSKLGESLSQYVDQDKLEQFSDVRGIRIEDMVLVTDAGYEVLSRELPTASGELEKLVGAAKATV